MEIKQDAEQGEMYVLVIKKIGLKEMRVEISTTKYFCKEDKCIIYSPRRSYCPENL